VNALLVLWRGGGRMELPRASKRELARALTGVIIERYLQTLRDRSAGQGTAEVLLAKS
jgi:hypothetical protein